MNSKPFEIDIKKRIRKLKTNIKNEFPTSNIDVNILITAYEKQEKMIELMAKDISNFRKTSSENIIEYYKFCRPYKKTKYDKTRQNVK